MFHIDTTFEDTRIIAKADNGFAYDCEIFDGLTGDKKQIQLSADQLSMVLTICLHPDSEPNGYEDMYKVLEPLFKDWPNNLRPIP